MGVVANAGGYSARFETKVFYKRDGRRGILVAVDYRYFKNVFVRIANYLAVVNGCFFDDSTGHELTIFRNNDADVRMMRSWNFKIGRLLFGAVELVWLCAFYKRNKRFSIRCH